MSSILDISPSVACLCLIVLCGKVEDTLSPNYILVNFYLNIMALIHQCFKNICIFFSIFVLFSFNPYVGMCVGMH